MSEPATDSAEASVRDRILAVATRLFARNGYGSTSVRAVVEQAGVTKPALYYYFDNKQALFVECVQLQFGRLEALVRLAVDGPGSLSARLHAFLVAYLEGALSDEDGVRLSLSAAHSPRAPGQPQVDTLALHLGHIALLEGAVQQAKAAGDLRAEVDPRAAVFALIGAANLHLVHALQVGVIEPGCADRILDHWLTGVGA